jgi:hypothetical protein
MSAAVPRSGDEAAARRGANLRTALILLSIALVFFGGIIVTQYNGGNAAGIGVLGLAIIGFLLVTLGRRFRKGAGK